MTVATITEKDLDYIETRMRDVFMTRDEFFDFKSELFEKLDKIVKNTSDAKDEVSLIESRVSKIENPSS